ncbi:zinc ribbon domain-containing protein, partial [uncultured Parolsenella sp.]|uniref:zinc ribbon domain-containing protein n=1 Tax=uncultured Parolsenella sp. TaxID=2083008 RepID=UPI0035A8AA98
MRDGGIAQELRVLRNGTGIDDVSLASAEAQRRYDQGGAMFCRKCGTKNADGAKFCINCGAELASPQPAPQPGA